MVVISTRELVQSRDKYFDMALTEPVVVRRKKRLYEIRPMDDDNPSPSGDPYYADPEKCAKIATYLKNLDKQFAEGNHKELKVEDINSFLGL